MFSKWAYVLIGDNNSGKTSFQRGLVNVLCANRYKRLRRNTVKDIVHPRAPKRLMTLFTCNRSFQEKREEYKSVGRYFRLYFKEADICILSSHAHGNSKKDVIEMIAELQQRCYNVAGVFWSNSFTSDAQKIALLPWQERMRIDNPLQKEPERVPRQLSHISREFAELLLVRAGSQ